MAAVKKRKKNLVIVESPAKVKTIRKFLGSNYDVAASNGHVRDLPKSKLGVDVEHDYEPHYITIRGKGELLAGLRKQVKKADRIYLATDPDREGEAISWHLIYALKLDDMPDKEVYRITFNEITKKAVTESLKNAREIDMDLVNAQQTRRILDRMVGYRISPLLWEKVKRGLSAGRVQSAALRMVGDREDEISSFIPQEYWTVDALLTAQGHKKPLCFHYYGDISPEGKTQKRELTDGAEVEKLKKELEQASFAVKDIKVSERTRKPPLPFTTSTLQQEASKSLNFSTQKTMRIAQQLYEGVEIKGHGTTALITYLRTDSTRISDEAKEAAAAFIGEQYGEEYLPENGSAARKESREGKIQDAHEAIRPTDVTLQPSQIKDLLPRDQFRLYQLIWKRFVAGQMSGARYEMTQVRVSADEKHLFTLSASRVLFDGFESVYRDDMEDNKDDGTLRFPLQKDTALSLDTIDAKRHFTQPAPHYTEASLVRAMEEEGIGRPSTYAPTITTIMARHYVAKENKNLYMTELGEVVNGIMKKSFPSIVDPRFTANMESLLDGIADGEVKWKTVVENFYPDLDDAVLQAEKDLEKVKIADEESDEICELCGRRMVIKYGPHGRFLACPGFPECHNTKPYYEKIGVACPKCGKDIVERKTRKGRKYYGCIDNPACDFMVWQKPSGINCPKCGGMMLEKGNRLVCMNEECGHVQERPRDEEAADVKTEEKREA
ncbi:MAG: type I DNA topoisomerase [Lachnospiraceae bacterium]|nr:type I DNA topoisomerase [Lachnospiraceae bacterium]